jgi:spore coat protein U-like protein
LELVSVRNGGKEAKMKKIFLIAGLMVWSIVFAGISSAATASGSLQVMATVGAACTVSTTALDFGTVYEGNTTDATGDVTVNCPSGTPYDIALDAGLNYDLIRRYISDGQSSLGYRLLKSDWVTQWGDSDHANTYPDGASLSDTGTGSDQPHAVNGRTTAAPSGLQVGATLTDTVTVSVYY